MMRNKSICCLVLFFLSISFSGQVHAETIYYTIRQIGFNGQASLSILGPKKYKNSKAILIVFKARSPQFFDEEDIYLDPETYKPLFVERNFNLGFFGHGKVSETYTQGQIMITKTEDGRLTHQVIRKDGQIDNIYGFIYRYRAQGSFKVGDVLNVALPTKDLKIRLVGRAFFKTGQRAYDSYYMQSQPERYKIWFDASEHKWPLCIMGTVGLMRSVMTMTGHDS